MISSILASEKICFGPMCDVINKTPGGEANNDVFQQMAGNTIGHIVRLAMVGGGLLMLFYLLWGGLDWILSQGEKEKLEKARRKITNAVIGLMIIVVAYTVVGLLAGDILGIFKRGTDGTWSFTLPSLIQ